MVTLLKKHPKLSTLDVKYLTNIEEKLHNHKHTLRCRYMETTDWNNEEKF